MWSERAAHEDREIRARRSMSLLAESRGASGGTTPNGPSREKRRRRSLEAIAIENAREGCVRETYGALVATWQGRVAVDPRFRATMKRIARDETQHAELAWAVAAWAEQHLSDVGRRRVADARRAALDALLAELAENPGAELTRTLGVPTASHARAAATELATRLGLS